MYNLNYSYIHGELSNSQKQAIIRLIEKKGKDRRYIKNWQPNIEVVNQPMKILGIYITHNSRRCNSKIFKENGNLKIQMIKTFAMPKLLFRASMITFDKEFFKKTLHSIV